MKHLSLMKWFGLIEACKNGDKLKRKHQAMFSFIENSNFKKEDISILRSKLSQKQMIKLLKNNPELIGVFI
jgi:hypothetical protein